MEGQIPHAENLFHPSSSTVGSTALNIKAGIQREHLHLLPCLLEEKPYPIVSLLQVLKDKRVLLRVMAQYVFLEDVALLVAWIWILCANRNSVPQHYLGFFPTNWFTLTFPKGQTAFLGV